jgi:excisionase family DNA binding protein
MLNWRTPLAALFAPAPPPSPVNVSFRGHPELTFHKRDCPAVNSPYLDIDQAAAYLGVSKRTIYNRRREIPRQPGVRKLLFKKEDLDAWVAKRPKRR